MSSESYVGQRIRLYLDTKFYVRDYIIGDCVGIEKSSYELRNVHWQGINSCYPYESIPIIYITKVEILTPEFIYHEYAGER